MVIIGVSAGVSYGQFQRLTAQVAPSPTAEQEQASPALAPTQAAAGGTEFITASTTQWTAAEKSGVTQPDLTKPIALIQPEPPLQRFDTTVTQDAARIAPALGAGIAALVDPIVEEATPDAPAAVARVDQTPIVTPIVRKASKPVVAAPEKLGFSTASHTKVTPGTLRRFRNNGDGEQEASSPEVTRDPDGTFEQVFPPRQTVARTPRATRPGVRASTRAAQRQARFQRTWSTGVYR